MQPNENGRFWKAIEEVFHVLLLALTNPMTYLVTGGTVAFLVIARGLSGGFSRLGGPGDVALAIFAIAFSCTLSILILLVIREVVCWYFKYNRVVDLLEQINHKLDAAALNQATNQPTPRTVVDEQPEPDGSGMS